GEQSAKRRYTAGFPGAHGGGACRNLARSQAMALQLSNEHKVNRMNNRFVFCPFTPAHSILKILPLPSTQKNVNFGCGRLI
ncbi:hypothetical protein ACVGWD_01640, partial [Enterobacter asburiae]